MAKKSIFPKSKSSENFLADEFMRVRKTKFGKYGKDGDDNRNEESNSPTSEGRNELQPKHNFKITFCDDE